MNGFEQIKAFYSWVFNNPDKARPTHISLYLFLWNQNNRSMWVEWFKCPYDLAMQGACIGNNKTYYSCLDQLQEWGLIEYKRGLNNYKAPMIKLIQLYDNAQLTEQVTVPLSEQVAAQVTVQQPVQLTEQLPAHINKLITDNRQLIIKNLKQWIDTESGIKKKKKEILFIDSEYFDLELLTEKLDNSQPPYSNANVEYYYNKMKNWSDENGKKKVDWLATCKNWILGDFKDGKLVDKNYKVINNGTGKQLTNIEKRRLELTEQLNAK